MGLGLGLQRSKGPTAEPMRQGGRAGKGKASWRGSLVRARQLFGSKACTFTQAASQLPSSCSPKVGIRAVLQLAGAAALLRL